MPLYEYQCGRCGRFEIIRKFSDAPLTACPTCGQDVQKLLSAPAIQFKGTGWYITDYARKSSGSGEAKSKDGGGSGGTADSGGKDGKDGRDGKDKAASGSTTSSGGESSSSSSSPTTNKTS